VSEPTKAGFGSRLIQRGLSGELGGKVTLDFAPLGLVCQMEAILADDESDENRSLEGRGANTPS
jgi:hypothetical protein